MQIKEKFCFSAYVLMAEGSGQIFLARAPNYKVMGPIKSANSNLTQVDLLSASNDGKY